MNRNFEHIDYLQKGNSRQQQAYSILSTHQVLVKLHGYNPILVGTIPIDIDIENSDLDIICYYHDRQAFYNSIIAHFGNETAFSIKERQSSGELAVVAKFVLDGFDVEIFGQNVPTKQQFGYRHMIIEYQLLNKKGEAFRQQIRALKRQGYKTEPAFGIALGLMGDAYVELLKLEIDLNT